MNPNPALTAFTPVMTATTVRQTARPAHTSPPMANNMAALLHSDGIPPLRPIDHEELVYLAALWDEPMVYITQFAQALDSVPAAYFLSHYIDRLHAHEWTPLNNDIVGKETGLSVKRWRHVREILMDAGVLLNRRELSASLYQIDEAKLESLLRANSSLNLLDTAAPPLSVNRLYLRSLMALGLSFQACLLLALVQAHSPHTPFEQRTAHSDWITLPEAVVMQHTHLRAHEQRRAIQALQDCGVLEHRFYGFPRRRQCRYSLQRLAELTTDYMQQIQAA